jgi:hypothetical protein
VAAQLRVDVAPEDILRGSATRETITGSGAVTGDCEIRTVTGSAAADPAEFEHARLYVVLAVIRATL